MSLRVGLIAPPWVPVPPTAYGGTEGVVADLARQLDALGAEVDLFSVGTSTCPVTRSWHYAQPVAQMNEGLYEVAHLLAAYEHMAEVGVDVVHDHTGLGVLVARAARFDAAPVVVTNHGPFGEEANAVYAQAPDASLVAISHSQASASARPVDAVIHHGIDLELNHYGPGDGGYLLFVGRMSPDKGVHDAVRIARLAGMPLVIAAKMRSAAEQDYFETSVRPLLAGSERMPSEVTPPERAELMRHAVALLNPIRWEEPFGLVMAESLACGTPVLSFAHGAAPEIVDDGRTGYLCADVDAMARAATRAACLDRHECRTQAERRFDARRMALDHLELYRAAIARWRPGAGRGELPVLRRRTSAIVLGGRRAPHPFAEL